jgi:hypothetical protein
MEMHKQPKKTGIEYFFLRDTHHKYRFFSSEPVHKVHVRFSKWKQTWETAKKKLMLLPARFLSREQAFEKILDQSPATVTIHHSGSSPKKIRTRFFFYLQRQRTLHTLLLILETLLLPLSGLMALLPGPNVFFAALALIMITQWRALRGINHLLKANRQFQSSSLLTEWRKAVKDRQPQRYRAVLEQISRKWNIQKLDKILIR